MTTIDWHPSRRRLRSFGVLLTASATLLAWWCGAGQRPAWWLLAAAAVVVTAVGWFVPAVLRTVYRVWMAAVWPIGAAVSLAALAVVYFGVLMPIGLCLRVAGRLPERSAGSDTNWRPCGPDDPRRALRQY